jgi:hypothetical protein
MFSWLNGPLPYVTYFYLVIYVVIVILHCVTNY